LLPLAPGAPAGSTVLSVIGMLVVLLTRCWLRCWLPDVPEVDEPERLPETEPDDELELEVEPEVDVEVWSCALAGSACSARAVTASAAKLKKAFMMGES
jgi:hypothetical protein